MTSSSETITERANEKYKKFVGGFFSFLQKRKMKVMKNEKDEKRNRNGNRGSRKRE